MLVWLRCWLVILPGIVISTVVMSSLSLLVSLFSSTGRMQHKLAKAWAYSILRIASIKVSVEGLDNVPPGGSYVFISNHQSYFDVPVILPKIAAQFRFLAKKPLFSVPFIGYHLKRSGHLAVDSTDPRESLKSMSEAARVIQEKGISILLFPEGGRTEGELAPFKDGAAYIAIKAGVPVVPIGLIGTGSILPVHGRVIRPGPVVMGIGKPIATIDLTLQDRSRLTQELHQRVSELLELGRIAEPIAR